jgi:hypothetical protein
LLTLHLPNIASICLKSLLDFKPYSNLKFPINFCGQYFYARFIGWLMVHLAWFFEHIWNSFQPKNSTITSFNFTNCVPMWSSVASLGSNSNFWC